MTDRAKIHSCMLTYFYGFSCFSTNAYGAYENVPKTRVISPRHDLSLFIRVSYLVWKEPEEEVGGDLSRRQVPYVDYTPQIGDYSPLATTIIQAAAFLLPGWDHSDARDVRPPMLGT